MPTRSAASSTASPPPDYSKTRAVHYTSVGIQLSCSRFYEFFCINEMRFLDAVAFCNAEIYFTEVEVTKLHYKVQG